MVTAGMLPRAAVREVEARLRAAGCPDADFDAAELFRLAAGGDVRLADAPLGAEQAERLEALTARRAAREPLQYLCGSWPFLDFELAVGPGVLCPRADTEVVAEAAAGMLAGVEAPRVLDLCAGTGCLGLGVKRFCPAAQVTSLEKSPAAYRYLEQNAHLSPVLTITPVRGDLFTYWQTLPEGQLDLIVSNPPYLTAAEMGALQPEVAQRELTEVVTAHPFLARFENVGLEQRVVRDAGQHQAFLILAGQGGEVFNGRGVFAAVKLKAGEIYRAHLRGASAILPSMSPVRQRRHS